MNVRHAGNGIDLGLFTASTSVSTPDQGVLNEESFQRRISIERKRTERSRKSFLLMLVDTGHGLPSGHQGSILDKIISALALSTRETDVTGWYKNQSIVGVMFTEIEVDDRGLIVSTMLSRMSHALQETLSIEQFNQISISFHLFPEDWDPETPRRPSNPALYPDLRNREQTRKFFRFVKRGMDIAGSLLALTLGAPLFLAVAVAIKATSRGPVFFRQQRVGQYGVPFVFLKFRSMYVDNDASAHREYVRQLIAGKADHQPSKGNGTGFYKLTDDPRVTRVGAFLRHTSLDELPQFINVLRGEMSLVGPRPPLAYEVEAYDIWHRRRVLEAKPGITGLWQVNGRSRVTFDEMVRLDLRYARTWSPWMDIKILLRTPRVVVLGEGAF